MDTVDICIVGAGVVGLAIAERLSQIGKDIVVIEKHDSFGRETSSRNSEVIHAGFYYPSDSLKARLCVDGNRRTYELCRTAEIPHRNTGKILIATNPDEEEKLHHLYEQGLRNGVPLSMIGPREIKEKEPLITGTLGLWSPTTGIVDSHQLMKYFETQATSRGVTIAYQCEVSGVARSDDGFEVTIRDVDGELTQLTAKAVINAAGLWSDRIAALAGIDVDTTDHRLHWCKGEYFSVSNRHRGKLTHLVYPAPTEISLGIHAVLRIDGSLKLGPNAFYVDKIDYTVPSEHQKVFFDRARTYLPFLSYDDLSPDTAGIRPKLQGPGEGFRDFVIQDESTRGVPGLIDLIGIESPGLTSAPAIAEMVYGIYAEIR